MHKFHEYFTHLFVKFQRNVIFFLLFIFFIGGFLTSEYLAKQDLKKNTEEKSICNALVPNHKKIVNQSESEVKLSKQKEKLIQSTIASLVAFTYKVIPLTTTKSEVIIQLQGSPSMKLDAADLVIKFTDNLKITDISPGSSFSSYPKKNLSKGEIAIAGVTSFEDNTVIFGQPNKPFVTLVVEKLGSITEKESLTIDEKNTGVFFQGVSVLDKDKSMKQIEL